jgi:hypothetical protein
MLVSRLTKYQMNKRSITRVRINVSGGCQIASLGQAKTFVQPHLILMCCMKDTLYPLDHDMFHFALGG